jgi:anaerobic magnesium-protoporphyrin IX monomethyl ester cyclase
MMRDAGLYLIYMGLESGNEEGLKVLHKEVSVEQNLRAVQHLKAAGLLFEFGFMLFDPSSTMDTVRKNLDFLRTILDDGCAAAVFCRMLPYDGTPIKDDLERSGRLRGDVCHPDYDFLDPAVTALYTALSKTIDVWGWIHGFRALSPQLNWAWNEVAIMERLFPSLPDFDAYKQSLRGITRASNEVLFAVLDDLIAHVEIGRPRRSSAAAFEAARKAFLRQLLGERNAFAERNQHILMSALLPADAGMTAASIG